MKLANKAKRWLSVAIVPLLLGACGPAMATAAYGAPAMPAVPSAPSNAQSQGATVPTVTLASNAQSLTVQDGQRFRLDLGSEYNWTVNVANPGIVSRVENGATAQGGQGLYEARHPGETILTATGTPNCSQGDCDNLSPINFQIVVAVLPQGEIGKGSIALPSSSTPLQFQAGREAAVASTNLTADQPQAYQVQAQAGQMMYVLLNGDAVAQVYEPQGVPLTGLMAASGPWGVELTETGTYTVALQGSGHVVLGVTIPVPANGRRMPTPANYRQIQFQTGQSATTTNANLAQGVPLGYSLTAQAGQQMTVTVKGDAVLEVLGPANQQSLTPTATRPGQWQYSLPASGHYRILLLGQGQISLTVSIPGQGTAGTY